MNTRKLLYALTLIAYTLSLAHSVIPHHHHRSPDDATTHHHEIQSHDHSDSNHHQHHHTKHQHDSNEQERKASHEGDVGHFFFFTHDLNVDVLTAHHSIDNPVKAKQSPTVRHLAKQPISFESKRHLVFHPPQDDKIHSCELPLQNKLRGPPLLTV